ncbi:MAG: hypothetical protein GX640_21970 [Fibrobacter sp.]|nr:hypothetical protein [Fibrobacter sp.]
MLVNLVNHEIRIPRFVSVLMDRKIEKLKRILYSFQPDTLQLHIDISNVKRKDLYQIRISLDLPGANLTVRAEHDDFAGGMGDVFQKLFRKIEEYKAGLRHESEFRKEINSIDPNVLEPASI